MVALTTPDAAFGSPAPPFSLPGIDGRDHVWSDIAGKKGTVVMFICNHCPYVKAVAGKLAALAPALRPHGVGVVAINANDAVAYPEDSFENMKLFAAKHAFTFPYLHDESQAVARAYGAVCTPDFFGYDATSSLRYRGRLDSAGRSETPGDTPELFNAMVQIAETGSAPTQQLPSIGCSIKWRD